MELTVASIAAAKRLGSRLGSIFKPGDVVCLSGDLGAGKTTLIQAMAAGLGVDAQAYVSSPTFAIMHEYRGDVTIYHMDFYRLGSSDDVLELGLDEYFYRDGVVLIEWCERAADLIPDSALFLSLTPVGGSSRKVVMKSADRRWQQRLEPMLRLFTSG